MCIVPYLSEKHCLSQDVINCCVLLQNKLVGLCCTMSSYGIFKRFLRAFQPMKNYSTEHVCNDYCVLKDILRMVNNFYVNLRIALCHFVSNFKQ